MVKIIVCDKVGTICPLNSFNFFRWKCGMSITYIMWTMVVAHCTSKHTHISGLPSKKEKKYGESAVSQIKPNFVCKMATSAIENIL